jgi:hypothetical protein
VTIKGQENMRLILGSTTGQFYWGLICMIIVYSGNARLAKVKGRLSQAPLLRHRSALLDHAGKKWHVFET